MRVGFDTSPIAEPGPGSSGRAWPPGITRVVTETLRALEERGGLEVVRLAPGPGESLRRWRARELPRRVRSDGLVGLHSFLSAFPWRGPGKRVQTVHELPWRHGVRENADLSHRLWASLGPLRADRVLCATEHVAADLRTRLLPGADRITVCPWGVDPERFANEPPPGEVDEVLLGHYRLLEDPLVLCPGAVREKKNLDAVLRGVGVVRERRGPRLEVVVTGGETPTLRRSLGLAAKLGISGQVTTLDHVEEEHLPGLLRLASVVPSLAASEGFGLPVLEALACGTPVLVPPDSSQAEVAGEHGIVVRPDDPESVADGLEHAVREREALRWTLPDRARELPWSRTAETIEQVWRELAP